MESGEFLSSLRLLAVDCVAHWCSSLPSAVQTAVRVSPEPAAVNTAARWSWRRLMEADGADNSSSTQTGPTTDMQGNNLRVTEEEEFKILQWFMIKHSVVELYVQYETLKGFKVKVPFNNLNTQYTSKNSSADIQKGKQWHLNRTAVKASCCLTYSWFTDTLYN